MRIDFDARLAASTVLVDGREWCQGTLTNLATNPGFEAAGSTVEVRRNDFPNPLMSNAGTVSGWLPRSTVSSDNPVWAGDRLAVNVTADGGGVYCSIGSQVGSVLVTVTAQTPAGARPELYLYNVTDNVWLPPAVGDYSGMEQTIEGFWQLPAAKETRIYVRLSGTLGTLTVRNATTDKLRQAYSGSTPSPDSDLTASWAGAVNGSATVLTGRLAAQLQASTLSQGIPYQTADTPRSGGKSLRYLLATAAAAGLPLAQPGAATTGTLYTMVMWVRASRAITVHPRVKGALTGGDGVTLGPGVWTLVRTTVTAGSGSDAQTGLLLDGNSGHQIGDTVDVDDFTIVQGEHPDLMPFHGSTVNPEWPGVTYAWTGPLNASTSTRTTPAIDRIEVDRDPGTGWVPVRGGRRDVINGFVALTDHEMPLHQEVRYRVAGYSGDMYVGAFTGTVDTSIPGWCGVFVKIPANPNATVMVDPTNSIDIDSSTQGGSYDIAAGSSIAVAAWSGVNASRFTLNALTKTDVDSAQMRALLQKNRVVLLQGPDWAPFPPGWYYVESVSEGLRGDGAIKQGRKWSLSLVSTGIPSGDTAGVAGASWNQIRAKYATWDELKTANDTWFDVLQGGN